MTGTAAAAAVKTDWVHRGLKFLDHNRYTAAAAVLSVAAVLWLLACESTTPGFVAGPDGAIAAVDRLTFERQAREKAAELARRKAELEIRADAYEEKVAAALAAEKAAIDAEIAAYNAEAEGFNLAVETGTEDLDRQDATRARLVELVGGTALEAIRTGAINPVAAATTAVPVVTSLLALGFAGDNRRKDGVLRKRPAADPIA